MKSQPRVFDNETAAEKTYTMNHQDLQKTDRSHKWPFDIRSLSAALGAEIVGINLEEAASERVFPSVYEAFLAYQAVLFRDVDLPPELQVAFARNFGEVQIHVMNQYHGYTDYPEIYFSRISTSMAIRAAHTRTRAHCTGTPTVPGSAAPASRP